MILYVHHNLTKHLVQAQRALANDVHSEAVFS